MNLRTSNWLQIVAATVILGGAVAAWVHRDRVEMAVTAILGVKADPAKTGRSGRGGRGRGGGALPVLVAPAGEGRNDVVLEAIGTARALSSITIYPPIAGEIIKSSVRAGARVVKDDALFVMDAKKARLAIRMAESKLLDAERKLARARQLRQRNVNSRAAVDDAKTVHDRAQVELGQVQETLRDLTIRAPFAGVLGIPKVELGDRVTTASALVTLDDRSELIVEFEVPERYMPRLTPNHAVAARTPGYRDDVFKGNIRSIDSRVDSTARTVTVRAAIPNGADKLRPGMSFSVEVILPGKVYPSVPELALQFSQTGNFVWAIDGDKVRKMPVKLVRRIDSAVLIDAPLSNGALVVVEGVQRLRPGRTVRYAIPSTGKARPRQALN